MKFSAATIAAVAGLVAASKNERTFGTIRFNGKELTRQRIDPVVEPGKLSQHLHAQIGGSAFGPKATGEDMAKSKCTSASVKEDKSAYWFPTLYFNAGGKFEPVDIFYSVVYYFFEPTDDEIKAFPQGLQMVAGNATTRVAPSSGEINLNPDAGDIQPVQFTCMRSDYGSSSWPENSDGSKAGLPSSAKTEGVGFPFANCDGDNSPLRADIHMPSCYNPDEGLDSWKTNMAWPTWDYAPDGSAKQNCPKGYIHVPHLFYEVYWDTSKFADRWSECDDEQPFILSNGDTTGFSMHADFLAAWDEDVLQDLIDNCDSKQESMHTCGGTQNTDTCEIEEEGFFGEKIKGIVDILPGDRPLEGWAYGIAEIIDGVVEDIKDGISDILPGGDDEEEDEEEGSDLEIPDIQHNAQNDDSKDEAPVFSEPAAPAISEEPEIAVAAEEPEDVATSCTTPKVHTVWETVTQTATATQIYGEGEPEAKLRRHVHNHAAHHRRNHF